MGVFHSFEQWKQGRPPGGSRPAIPNNGDGLPFYHGNYGDALAG
jgi:hypothetical protein